MSFLPPDPRRVNIVGLLMCGLFYEFMVSKALECQITLQNLEELLVISYALPLNFFTQIQKLCYKLAKTLILDDYSLYLVSYPIDVIDFETLNY